jgi:hypothetical protein
MISASRSAWAARSRASSLPIVNEYAGHCTSPRGPSYAEPLQAFLRGTEEELPEDAAKMARSN